MDEDAQIEVQSQVAAMCPTKSFHTGAISRGISHESDQKVM